MIVRLGRYAGFYLATIAVLVAIALVMTQLLETSSPSWLSVLLPPLVGAVFEGQRLAREGREAITGREAWRAALAMTAVALVIDVAGLAASFTVPGIRGLLASYSPALFAFSGVALAFLLLLANRYGLTFAFNNERKRMGGK